MRGRQPGFPRLLSNQEPINEPESPRGQVERGKITERSLVPGPSTIINMQRGPSWGAILGRGQFPKCCLVSEQIASWWQCGTCIINGLFALSLQILIDTGTQTWQNKLYSLENPVLSILLHCRIHLLPCLPLLQFCTIAISIQVKLATFQGN